MSEKVKIEDREIVISKLPLGRYGELMNGLKVLSTKLNLNGEKKDISKLTDEIFAKLPSIIAESLPDFLEIISIGTGLTLEEVNALSLNEAIDCVMAVVKVNQFVEVWEKIKKGTARLQTAKKEIQAETPPANPIG